MRGPLRHGGVRDRHGPRPPPRRRRHVKHDGALCAGQVLRLPVDPAPADSTVYTNSQPANLAPFSALQGMDVNVFKGVEARTNTPCGANRGMCDIAGCDDDACGHWKQQGRRALRLLRLCTNGMTTQLWQDTSNLTRRCDRGPRYFYVPHELVLVAIVQCNVYKRGSPLKLGRGTLRCPLSGAWRRSHSQRT